MFDELARFIAMFYFAEKIYADHWYGRTQNEDALWNLLGDEETHLYNDFMTISRMERVR
jgi:hypothetical protein